MTSVPWQLPTVLPHPERAIPEIKRCRLSTLPLIQGWPQILPWKVEYNGSDILGHTSPELKRTGSFHLLLSEIQSVTTGSQVTGE